MSEQGLSSCHDATQNDSGIIIEKYTPLYQTSPLLKREEEEEEEEEGEEKMLIEEEESGREFRKRISEE